MEDKRKYTIYEETQQDKIKDIVIDILPRGIGRYRNNYRSNYEDCVYYDPIKNRFYKDVTKDNEIQIIDRSTVSLQVIDEYNIPVSLDNLALIYGNYGLSLEYKKYQGLKYSYMHLQYNLTEEQHKKLYYDLKLDNVLMFSSELRSFFSLMIKFNPITKGRIIHEDKVYKVTEEVMKEIIKINKEAYKVRGYDPEKWELYKNKIMKIIECYCSYELINGYDKKIF